MSQGKKSFLEFLGFFLAINFIWFNETAAKDFNEIQKFYINRASYCHFKWYITMETFQEKMQNKADKMFIILSWSVIGITLFTEAATQRCS